MDILIAFWLSGWAIVIWKLVFPAFRIAVLTSAANGSISGGGSDVIAIFQN